MFGNCLSLVSPLPPKWGCLPIFNCHVDFVICRRWEHLVYQLGGHDELVMFVIKKGSLVYKRPWWGKDRLVSNSRRPQQNKRPWLYCAQPLYVRWICLRVPSFYSKRKEIIKWWIDWYDHHAKSGIWKVMNQLEDKRIFALICRVHIHRCRWYAYAEKRAFDNFDSSSETG